MSKNQKIPQPRCKNTQPLPVGCEYPGLHRAAAAHDVQLTHHPVAETLELNDITCPSHIHPQKMFLRKLTRDGSSKNGKCLRELRLSFQHEHPALCRRKEKATAVLVSPSSWFILVLLVAWRSYREHGQDHAPSITYTHTKQM